MAKAPKDFGAARARLDEILAELEADTADVDQLAARIKEAAGLIRFCRERLSAARAEVQQVVAELAREEQAVDGGEPPAGSEDGAGEDGAGEDGDGDGEEAGGELPF